MLLTDATRAALRNTAEAFAAAARYVLATSRNLKTSNKVKLQHACYREIRERHGLSANLAIRAIARVAYAVKIAAQSGKTVREFRPTSIDYDLRIFAWRRQDESVSLTTVNGRIHVPLKLGRYQREVLAGKNPTCARAVRQGSEWVIHIVVDEADPPKQGGPPLGIDLGIRSIAVLSTGKNISGKTVHALKDRYAAIRASLQSKGTRGARRLLKRLSGRERRMVAWINHNVSKAIVQEALANGCGILRFENLKGIRKRTRSWSKHRNRMVSGWSFGELQTFSTYKGARAGLVTEFVNPAHTSQTCSWCGKLGVRSGETFVCATCGPVHADWNAARNIAAGGVEPGVIPGARNATRIGDELVNFFGRSHLHQSKAAEL
jgi:IS605 OrfB family transposase